MKIIVGLGNPEKKYEGTRHNVGFALLDELNKKYGNGEMKLEKKWKSLASWATINGEKALLMKPQTYMNLSGQAVVAAMGFFKVDLQDIIVIHDDLDLDFGTIRHKKDGGHGGNNGIRSIIAETGQKGFNRIKIGIKTEQKAVMGASGFVLGKFNDEERKKLPEIMQQAEQKLLEML